MYNTEINSMPAYTNREFVNFGLHKNNELYSYKFTANDRNLLISGAISLFPKSLYEYKVSHDTVLGGKKFISNEVIDYKIFEENVLNTLLKTGIIKCNLKPEFENLPKDELIKKAKLYNMVGLSIKDVAEQLNIELADIRTALGLKSNTTKKQIKEEDLEKIQELL